MFALLLVALALGLSNFAAAIGIGLSGVDNRARVRVGIVFGLFETGMPILSLALGRAAASKLSTDTQWIGAALLIATGTYGLLQNLRGADDEREAERTAYQSLGRLLVTGLALSVDNLAVGFALGTYKVGLPVAALTIGAVSVTLSLSASSWAPGSVPSPDDAAKSSAPQCSYPWGSRLLRDCFDPGFVEIARLSRPWRARPLFRSVNERRLRSSLDYQTSTETRRTWADTGSHLVDQRRGESRGTGVDSTRQRHSEEIGFDEQTCRRLHARASLTHAGIPMATRRLISARGADRRCRRTATAGSD